MKLVCAFCGFPNKTGASVCAKCGGSLENAVAKKFRLPWASWVPIVPVALFLFWQESRARVAISDLESDHRKNVAELIDGQMVALKKLEAEFASAETNETSKHQLALRDSEIVSGRKAAERHATEWERRQKHDVAFARSVLERTLIDVERLGRDEALTAEEALKKVTEMVCPPGSRIEVTPSGSRFVVRVAFRLSAIAPMEAGSFTYHTSSTEMHRQVEEATARLIKALFDYCGSRGIERISVSCNRAITEGEEGGERLRMRSLYRASVDAASASEIANWRSASLAQVVRVMKVERDITKQITMRTSGVAGLPLDPNEPLEF